MDYSKAIQYAMEHGKYAVLYFDRVSNSYSYQYGSDDLLEVEDYYNKIVDTGDKNGVFMFIEDSEQGVYNRDTDTFFLFFES